jgi:hypothetical protein
MIYHFGLGACIEILYANGEKPRDGGRDGVGFQGQEVVVVIGGAGGSAGGAVAGSPGGAPAGVVVECGTVGKKASPAASPAAASPAASASPAAGSPASASPAPGSPASAGPAADPTLSPADVELAEVTVDVKTEEK